MPRKPFVGGNWKCNGTTASGTALVDELKKGSNPYKNKVEVVVCPVVLQIPLISKLLKRSHIGVGAQNISMTAEGAFTGEVTAGMVKDFGLSWTIVGHSERRSIYGEDDATCAAKVEKAQKAGISTIFCVGESLAEREKNETDAVNKRMIDAVIPKITDWKSVVVAYEPVWAIGTGKVATPDQAQDAHAAIRKTIAEAASEEVASNVRIIYGGSVTADNCTELIDKPDIDGFLVGGASLKPAFTKIVTACIPVKPLRTPKFIKVSKIEPEMRGVNIYAKVVKLPEAVGDTDLREVVVGDDTAIITLRVRGERAKICEVGKAVRVQNAHVNMFKGFIRLEVDKWTALAPTEEAVGEVNEKKDISAVEYELAQ